MVNNINREFAISNLVSSRLTSLVEKHRFYRLFIYFLKLTMLHSARGERFAERAHVVVSVGRDHG